MLLRRLVIALSALALVSSATPVLGEGEIDIWGRVYTSKGVPALDAPACQSIDCHTTIKVIVHLGSGVKEYLGSVRDGSLYSITIGSDGWAPGARYQVWVDGRPWGDVNYAAADMNSTGSVHDFFFPSDVELQGSIPLNLRAAGELPLAGAEPENIKPLMALAFATVLVIAGLLLLVLLPRQTVVVEFTKKRKVGETDTKGTRTTCYSYECSYGTKEGTTVIGEIVKSPEDVELLRRRRVSVTRLLRRPDGGFTWHDPRVLPLKAQKGQVSGTREGQDAGTGGPDGVSLEIMDEADVEGLWRAGGKVSLHRGQDPRQAVRRKKANTFLTFALPIVVLELAIGGISAFTGFLAVPKTLEGLLVNLIVLAIGVAIQIALFNSMRKPKRVAPGPGQREEVVEEPPI